jgi:hypothetical protein
MYKIINVYAAAILFCIGSSFNEEISVYSSIINAKEDLMYMIELITELVLGVHHIELISVRMAVLDVILSN